MAAEYVGGQLICEDLVKKKLVKPRVQRKGSQDTIALNWITRSIIGTDLIQE